MPILRKLPFALEPDTLLRSLGDRGSQPATQEAARTACALATELAEPAAAYEIVAVDAIAGDTAVVGDGVHLQLGPHADLLAPAQRAFAWVLTAGATLEERVNQLFAEDQALEGYFLDAAATMVLGLAAENIKTLVEAEAEELGWGVGRRLAPGSLVGWPVRDQDQLLSLVPAAEIGVTITKSHMLMPRKSTTALVGIGPGYKEHTVGTVCHLCNLRATCWRRRN
jgi:hypothetical protein